MGVFNTGYLSFSVELRYFNLQIRKITFLDTEVGRAWRWFRTLTSSYFKREILTILWAFFKNKTLLRCVILFLHRNCPFIVFVGQEIDIINPQSSSNDSPLRELTSMHCGTTSPLSGNFSCRSSNVKVFSHNPDENGSQDPRESWCSSNYYSGSQFVNSYDKCHEMDKYDHAMGRISRPFRHALLPSHVRYSSQRFIIEEEGEYCEPRQT